jgi:putative ABC transport system permease protein
MRSSAPDVSSFLNAAGRGNVQGGFRSSLRKLLVVGEIALALVALAGAGLFIRSLRNARNLDLGFDANHLLVTNLNMAALQMPPEQGREFIRSVIAKVHTIPGVTAVAVSHAPVLGVGLFQTVFHEGDPTDSRLGMFAATPPISPEYFDTKRVSLLDGRKFNEFDRAGGTPVAIVSETFAKHMWPGQRAIGKRFRFATSSDLQQVVGVVKDHTLINIGEEPQAVAWLPFDQVYQPFAVLHVRTEGSPSTMLHAVIDAAQSLNSNLVLLNPQTAQEVLSQALWAPRMAALRSEYLGCWGLRWR